MTRILTTIVLSLLLAAPMEAVARQGQGGGGRRLSFPSHGGSRHGWGGGHRGHGGHGHGGHSHHHGHGSDFFFYGSFGSYWYPGWPYRPYLYPYYAYYYPYYGYPYSYPPVPYRVEAEEYDYRDVPEESAPPADTAPASYGLIRLDGVPDAAAIELDGRFWLTADGLDDRWLALPQGEHRIAVTVGDAEPVVRTIRIVPGRTHVVKFAKTR